MLFVSMSQSAAHSELFLFKELLNSFLALPILQFSFNQATTSQNYYLTMWGILFSCNSR